VKSGKVILSPVGEKTGDKIACPTAYNGRMDISRRQLAGVVLAATASAQAPPKPEAEADAAAEAARLRQRTRAEAIARVPLPMTTEPAFQFKA
jgi:hypothetical protein